MLAAAETEELPQTKKEDIRNIFLNVAHLLPINRTLLESVTQRVNRWTPNERIGDVFLKMVSFPSLSPSPAVHST